MLLKLSNDISRIIRIDCTSVQQMKKAIWAQKYWQPDQHFTPFFPHISQMLAYEQKDISTFEWHQHGLPPRRTKIWRTADRTILLDVYSASLPNDAVSEKSQERLTGSSHMLHQQSLLEALCSDYYWNFLDTGPTGLMIGLETMKSARKLCLKHFKKKKRRLSNME
uniref:Uncharacterized protein n=1 Tax=Coccidioides posadasii RMSCC 3488 TaxID=454284 RepID=A0A0J6FH35_COCPO|nr:hypothetical protein CPAG_04961 [Coccidioides posadasii RMSCC 3488]